MLYTLVGSEWLQVSRSSCGVGGFSLGKLHEGPRMNLTLQPHALSTTAIHSPLHLFTCVTHLLYTAMRIKVVFQDGERFQFVSGTDDEENGAWLAAKVVASFSLTISPADVVLAVSPPRWHCVGSCLGIKKCTCFQ